MDATPLTVPEELARGVRRARAEHIDRELYEEEKRWRWHPGDGEDPRTVSGTALRREIAVEHEIAARLGPAATGPEDARRHGERRRIKYFPVLFVSAPHIEEGATGAFPGMPTPLLYATCVLDRMLRIDEFPGARVPEVVAVLNPPAYSPAFEEELVARLREHRPVVVGISNLSEGHHFALRIAATVKKECPRAIVVLGGQHEDAVNPDAYRAASRRVAGMSGRRQENHDAFRIGAAELGRLTALQTLARPVERELMDIVFAGDSAFALPEVLKVVADCLPADPETVKKRMLADPDRFAELPGVGSLFMYDWTARRIESVPLSGAPIDGDRLPYIDVTRLTHENRFAIFGHRRTAQIMACLGCKYACSFCHESADAFLYEQPKIRQRSPQHVIGEIRLRIDQGFEAVFFDDSTFTQNRRWLAEFLTLLEEVAAGHGTFEWGCQTTVNDVDRELLERMSGAGCSYVYFGVESAEPDGARVQKVRQLLLVSKADWTERFRDVAHWCRKAGIRVGTSLQFGLGETPEQRLRTLDLVAELHRDGCIPDGCVALNVNSPYPGTRQWLQMLQSGAALPDYREKLVRHPAFETAHQFSAITGPDVEALYLLAADRLGRALHQEQPA
ncbi:B12-binding domain-containing radical SAM protein [Streptomyces malaysiensis]|uniref:Fe-S oxidoreductase n=1 Tax=Streptomyces malaysiensis TaxID=92644 RepID=A0A7X5X107_STRMQ|nr:radical SAM protein [Streptomyces malaysiensis]NIY63835.1 Fe-S oxidoreductase [Streptomyces malaysiensis]